MNARVVEYTCSDKVYMRKVEGSIDHPIDR